MGPVADLVWWGCARGEVWSGCVRAFGLKHGEVWGGVVRCAIGRRDQVWLVGKEMLLVSEGLHLVSCTPRSESAG